MKRVTFSIIIPTHNRPQALKRCLESISKLDYPQDCYEVIVVHDGHPDDPSELARIIQGQGAHLLTQTHSGPAAARNLGAEKAKFDILAFLDDDCTVSTQWLKTLASCSDVSKCMLGGRTTNGSRNCYAEASQMLVDFLYDTFYRKRLSRPFLTSNNMSLPRDLFIKTGGFHRAFKAAASEDREFCYRWKSFGHEILYLTEAEVVHHREMSLGSFWRQHFGYGSQAKHLHRVLSAQNIKIRFEPASFYLKLIFFPLRRIHGGGAIRFVLLLMLTQIANAIGFYVESLKFLVRGERIS